MTTIYDNAKTFVENGISVFPVAYRGKKPTVPHWEPWKEKLPTDAELRAWFPTNLRNYGVCLGWQRLAVLDFDDMDAWYEWNLYALNFPKHPLDNAYCVKTSRGMHVYFSLLEERDNLKLPGIDFKTHGYVIGPGSTHPSGHVYNAMGDFHLPIIERLTDVISSDMLEQAVSASEYSAIAPVVSAGAAPTRDLWDELDQPALITGVLSPLEAIKARWKIENFFPGVKPAGKWMRVLCPFHDDKEPSAWVNVEKQLFGCHSCNMKPMSVVGFYAAMYTGGNIKAAMEKMR